MISIKNWSCLF